MANTWTEVTDKLLAQGLVTLRQNSIMPLLVNRSYDTMAAQRGDVINIPVPSAVTAQDVTPGPNQPANSDSAPTSVAVPLDQWKEAPFFMTDKEALTVMDGVIPMQAAEAVKSLANIVDNYILALYKGVYGYTGTAGTTPFATDTSDATKARAILNKQLAPLDDRRFIVDPDAEASALNLRAFQDMSWAGNDVGILDGKVERRFGFSWHMDQNIPTHTAGTITTGLIAKAATVVALGAKTVVATTAASTGAAALLVGDIITFAGHSQTYVLTANATQASAASDVSLAIEPGLKKALAGSEAITVKASHVVNLAMHRDAIAFASRPLMDSNVVPGVLIRTAVDPISGLVLRLEITRQHKQTRYSYDILYGGKLIQAALATRVAG